MLRLGAQGLKDEEQSNWELSGQLAPLHLFSPLTLTEATLHPDQSRRGEEGTSLPLALHCPTTLPQSRAWAQGR